MADGLREPLAEGVESLRFDVQSAGSLNAKTLCCSAETRLASLASFVVETSDLQAATFQTIEQVKTLARALYTQARIDETEEARQRALAAIDRLASQLRTTTLNQRAKSLGF